MHEMNTYRCLSVRISQQENTWKVFVEFCMDFMPLGIIPQLHYSVFYSRQYQHGGRTYMWRGTDTSAKHNTDIQNVWLQVSEEYSILV